MKNYRFILLVAGIAATWNACKVEVPQDPQDQIIGLSFTSDTVGLKANGTSRIDLKAQIPAGAVSTVNSVTFNISANLGSFVGSTGTTTSASPVDNSGFATTSIQVSNIPGTYYVSAQVKKGDLTYRSKEYPVTLRALAISDKLALNANNLTPVADGQTPVTITVSAPYITEKTVKLTTKLGSFPQSSDSKSVVVTLDNKGNGSAQFQMDNSVAPHYIVGAFSDNVPVTLTLNPQLSRPDTLIVESPAARFDTTGTAVVVNVYPKKTSAGAIASAGIPISYTAYQMIGATKKTVGRFSGTSQAVTDSNGAVTSVNFYADTGGIDPKQEIIIEVTAPKTATLNNITGLHLKLK